MPRKTKPKQASSVAPALALSDLHRRLQGMEKEHQALLKKIQRKQREMEQFVEEIQTLATQLFQHASSRIQTVTQLNEEIHELFAEILSKRKFGKQTLQRIKSIYRNLQLNGLISPKAELEEDPELDDFFSFLGEEAEENRFGYGQRQAQPAQAVPSAPRQDTSRNVRQTFLRLAEIFHPDRVSDEETRQSHTEVMKEINKAYQSGDLARLLEIERQHQQEERIDVSKEDELSRRCETLAVQNKELSHQYAKLERELRQIKNTPEGAMVMDARRGAKEGMNVIDEMVEEMEAEMAEIIELRDFVKAFREKKITIKEFLRGPSSAHCIEQEMLEDMLAALLGGLSPRGSHY